MKRFSRNSPWRLFLYPAFCFILKTRSCSFVLTFLYRYDHPSIIIFTNRISWDKIVLLIGTTWAHRSIFMGTGPLFWWNRDYKREPHTSDLFKHLACLCRTRHFGSQRPYSNPSICQSGSELFKLMLSESSGLLEDEVKFKERVQ